MAEIVFRPSDPEEEEHAEAHLQAVACIEYLRPRVEQYAIPDDRDLLEWIQQARDQDVVPEAHWKRVRLMVDEIWPDEHVCTMLCRICGRRIEPREVSTDEWDGVDPKGNFVGGAGHRLLCGQGHSLLMVWTRIY